MIGDPEICTCARDSWGGGGGSCACLVVKHIVKLCKDAHPCSVNDSILLQLPITYIAVQQIDSLLLCHGSHGTLSLNSYDPMSFAYFLLSRDVPSNMVKMASTVSCFPN